MIRRIKSVILSSVGKANLGNVKNFCWRFRNTSYQIAVSLGAGATIIIIDTVRKSKPNSLTLGTFGSYFGFLGGIAAILVLVGSMTVALLVYYFQSVKADFQYFCDRFRLSISGLRSYLDTLHDNGIISRSYDAPYRVIENMPTSKNMSLSWGSTVIPFTEIINEELRDKLGETEEFDWAYGRIITHLSLAEEAINGVGLNLIQRINLQLWTRPVLKSFWTLAALIVAALVAVIQFSGFWITALNGLAIGCGSMTLLLLVETGLIAIQESTEFFDIRTDASHDMK